MRRHSLVVLLTLGSLIFESAVIAQIPSQFEEDRPYTPLQIQSSIFYYRLTLGKTTLTGLGPEVGLLRPVASSWAITGNISQAYNYDKALMTMFTGFDIGLWYSVVGHFAQETHRWKQNGITVVDYVEKPNNVLRVGLSMQQYFLNTSKGAIPFSGIAVKGMYDFNFDLPFIVSGGAEWARLANNADKITATRILLSLGKKLNP